ncbi:MAG: hypothetical protein AB7D57_11140, partial [Desulfovibrionaceae bacterium]
RGPGVSVAACDLTRNPRAVRRLARVLAVYAGRGEEVVPLVDLLEAYDRGCAEDLRAGSVANLHRWLGGLGLTRQRLGAGRGGMRVVVLDRTVEALVRIETAGPGRDGTGGGGVTPVAADFGPGDPDRGYAGSPAGLPPVPAPERVVRVDWPRELLQVDTTDLWFNLAEANELVWQDFAGLGLGQVLERLREDLDVVSSGVRDEARMRRILAAAMAINGRRAA